MVCRPQIELGKRHLLLIVDKMIFEIKGICFLGWTYSTPYNELINLRFLPSSCLQIKLGHLHGESGDTLG